MRIRTNTTTASLSWTGGGRAAARKRRADKHHQCRLSAADARGRPAPVGRAWIVCGSTNGFPGGGACPTLSATPREGYNLVNLYLGYQPTPDILTALTVENLLDEYDVRYLDGLPSPGITFKGRVKIRFGAG